MKAKWIIDVPEGAELKVVDGQKVSAEDVVWECGSQKKKASVGGKLSVEDSKVVIVFEAEKFDISDSNGGVKFWSKFDLTKKYSFEEITYRQKGKVIIGDGYSDLMRIKAEVLGVRGIICVDVNNDQLGGENIEYDRVFVAWIDEIEGLLEKGSEVDCLIDPSKKRLLIVVE